MIDDNIANKVAMQPDGILLVVAALSLASRPCICICCVLLIFTQGLFRLSSSNDRDASTTVVQQHQFQSKSKCIYSVELTIHTILLHVH